MLFRAAEVTLSRPDIAGTSHKIIIRAITIIRASLRLSEGEDWVKNLYNYLAMWTMYKKPQMKIKTEVKQQDLRGKNNEWS